MEIINEMNEKFFGLKKKTNNNNDFIVFTGLLSIIFFLLYLAGFLYCFVHNFLMVFACCCLNMSFIRIPVLKPKTLPAVCADLVNP